MKLTGSPHTNEFIINWSLTAFAGVLTAGRYAIRWLWGQKLYWDDLAHLLAFLLLIARGALDEAALEYKDQIKQASAAKVPSAVLLSMKQKQLYLDTINNCTLFLCFWTVKLTFLLFYRQLFNANRKFNIAWWIVLSITCALIFVPLAGVLVTCVGATTLADYQGCLNDTNARSTKLIYSCVVNVVTDLAIMALPLWMLRDLNLRPKHKVALVFVFSLALVTVALDITRTIQAALANQVIYTVVEINLTIMLSCLPTYRALFKFDRRKGNNYLKQGSGSTGTSQRDRFSLFWPRTRNSTKNHEVSTSDKNLTELKAIRVQRGFSVEYAGCRDPYHIELDSRRQSLADEAGVPAECIASKDEQDSERQLHVMVVQMHSTVSLEPDCHSKHPDPSEFA